MKYIILSVSLLWLTACCNSRCAPTYTPTPYFPVKVCPSASPCEQENPSCAPSCECDPCVCNPCKC